MMNDWFEILRIRYVRWKNRKAIRCSEQQVARCLAAGAIEEALEGLRQQQQWCWPFQVERLLFRRQSRPTDPGQALDLLEGLAQRDEFRSDHRFYARIALIHTALSLDDTHTPQPHIVTLTQQAQLNLNDLRSLQGRQRNREHPWKQLISARACLLQWAMADADRTLCSRIAAANLRLISATSWRRLPADVLLRSVSNLIRGLLPLSFDGQDQLPLLQGMQVLQAELIKPRFRKVRQRAKEDHLAQLDAAVSLLQTLLVQGDSPDLRRRRLTLMLNSGSASVLSGARRLWGADPYPL
jgi:hypothetical protein